MLLRSGGLITHIPDPKTPPKQIPAPIPTPKLRRFSKLVPNEILDEVSYFLLNTDKAWGLEDHMQLGALTVFYEKRLVSKIHRGKFYVVEDILTSRKEKGELVLFVEWFKYDFSEASWEWAHMLKKQAPVAYNIWLNKHRKNKLDYGYLTPNGNTTPEYAQTPTKRERHHTGYRSDTESESDSDSDYEPAHKRGKGRKKGGKKTRKGKNGKGGGKGGRKWGPGGKGGGKLGGGKVTVEAA